MAARDAWESSLPLSSATSNRARSSTVVTTPPAAPSPCFPRSGERTSLPAASTWYGGASACSRLLAQGQLAVDAGGARHVRGLEDVALDQGGKGIPATAMMGREAQE